MSRSNPTDNAPHPCTRWIEWDGSNGEFRYYDKDQKKNVGLGDALNFILLDQLATIKGWHDASDSGISSNDVRDTRQDVLVVKAFKGGQLAAGVYQHIRDRVIAQGGYFTTKLYVAVKAGEELEIASVAFKGAALNAWVEFSKKNRADLYKKAVLCKGFNEGKKGKITFRTPIFHMKDVSAETDSKALDCDRILQEYLKGYFSRPKAEQAEQHPSESHHVDQAPPDEPDDTFDQPTSSPAIGKRGNFDDLDDDIPF